MSRGVTLVRIPGRGRTVDHAREHTRRWCRDRAVPEHAADRIVLLAQSATRRGLGYAPENVAISLSWLDPDRVALDVCSHGCAHLDHDSPAGEDGDVVFDAASEEWGLRVDAADATHWFVVDTSH